MPTRKLDPAIHEHHHRDLVRFGIPFCIIFLLAIFAHQSEYIAWFVVLVVVDLAIALLAVVRHQRLFRRYHCPDCGRRLQPPSRESGKPIEFYCSECDVIWDSGFVESSD